MGRRESPVRKSFCFGAAATAGLVCLVAAWAGSLFGQAGPGVLKLSVVDEATKQATPARVEILDKDGKAFIAQDALLIGGD
jgi:hypothetical protein